MKICFPKLICFFKFITSSRFRKKLNSYEKTATLSLYFQYNKCFVFKSQSLKIHNGIVKAKFSKK